MLILLDHAFGQIILSPLSSALMSPSLFSVSALFSARSSFNQMFCTFLCLGIILVYVITTLRTRRHRKAEEHYHRHMLAQGEQHDLLPKEHVQSELQRIGRMSKLRQAELALVIVLLMVFISSFVFDVPWQLDFFNEEFVPTGQVVIQERDIGDFSSVKIIDIRSAISVEFKPSDRDYVTVETYENMLPHIVTEIQYDTLFITRHRRYRNVKDLYVTVYSRTVPQLFDVRESHLICEEPLNVEAISFQASRASQLHFADIESAVSVNIKIDGASSLEIAGKSDTVHTQMKGASKLFASHFESNTCDADLSGTSSATFGEIIKELSVRTSGASHFGYHGTPPIIKQRVYGSSKITPH